MFRVDTKTYVASDVEWLLSLVNGRIFCPDELAKPGDPPHLHCALNGCTTVADFQACFRDTRNEALLLELFQKIEICYRTGHHLRELVFPSLIRACDDLDCWPAAEGYENIATCLRCRNPEQFSAGFFPKLQVRLHTMWKVRYGMSDVPLFAGGVKVTLHRGVSPVEALIVLARGSFDTHIVVRAKLDHRERAKRLHQLLIEVVKDTARDISQGTEFVEKSLTHHDIALPVCAPLCISVRIKSGLTVIVVYDQVYFISQLGILYFRCANAMDTSVLLNAWICKRACSSE